MVPKSLFSRNGNLTMGHMPNRSKAMGLNPTLLYFHFLVYLSELCFLLIRIIGLDFRYPCAGVERQTLRKTVDLQDRVPCQSLAPETSDRNR
jgi:hypothetical protein